MGAPLRGTQLLPALVVLPLLLLLLLLLLPEGGWRCAPSRSLAIVIGTCTAAWLSSRRGCFVVAEC
jgi:hypothetical protein